MTRRRLLLGIALLLAIAGGVMLFRERRLRARPNVVVIVIDTLRRDHLAAYGYARETAPFITSIAKQSALFDAISPTSWTKPGTASILTGLHPLRHQAISRGDRLPDGVSTLAELLRARGYHTAGIAANGWISEDFGFAQGFDGFRFYEDADAPYLNAMLLPNLSKLQPPFFLYVHYIDPHAPYHPAASWNGTPLPARLQRGLTQGQVSTGVVLQRDPQLVQDAIDLYDGEIRQADSALGALWRKLTSLGLTSNTILVITADHGEEFEEHGLMGHGQTLYREVTEVPLVIHAPKIRAGRRQGIASLIDIVPTILDLAGQSEDTRFDGISLGDALRTNARIAERTFLLHYDYSDANEHGFTVHAGVALETPAHKLAMINRPFRKELFDVRSDHEEKRNLWTDAALRARLASELQRDFETLLRKRARRERGNPSELLRSLKALGYTAGSEKNDPRLIAQLHELPDDVPYGKTGWEETPPGACVDASALGSDVYLHGDWYDADGSGRWTGGGPAAVVLPHIATNAYKLSVQGVNHGPNAVTVDFTMSGAVRATTTVPGAHPFTLSFPVAAGEEQLIITTRSTFRPSDYGGGDHRRLGIAIKEVCVK